MFVCRYVYSVFVWIENRINDDTYEAGGLGNATWCIFQVATDDECSSAA